MSFSYRYLGLIALMMAVVSLAVSNLACTDGQGEVVTPPIGKSGENATINFEHDGTLTLLPGQTVEVAVVSEPADYYEVAFYLVGDALDASLDHTLVVADVSGRAVATLRAPNGPTIFAVRATIKNGPSADLPVAVSEQGIGTLSVTPEYAGDRPTHTWIGSVVAGTNCEALGPTLPTDPEGALPAVAATGKPLIVPAAPVGPNLAIAVRAGHYMWGCADEANLVAGQVTEVTVYIVNKPIVANDVRLDIDMDFVPDAVPWQKLSSESIAMMLDVFLGSWSTENEALLEAMCAQSLNSIDCQAARIAGGWDELVASYLLTNGVSLTDSLNSWIEQGLAIEPFTNQSLVDSQRTDVDGFGILAVEHVGGITPAQAGLPKEYLVPFAVDMDDAVRLGGTLFWMPSKYFGAAAARGATQQLPGSSTVGEALTELIGCDQLASLLGGFIECGTNCMQQLCEAAVESSWQLALAASTDTGMVGELTLEASGQAKFDDTALLTGFNGTWLGKVSNGLLWSDVQGVISAQTAEQPARSADPSP